jgi:IS30 family transposase
MVMEKLWHGKNARELAKAVVRLLTACRQHVHTITGDNGTEFADHQAIASALKAQLFSHTPILLGKRGSSKIPTSLFGSTSPKKRASTTLASAK